MCVTERCVFSNGEIVRTIRYPKLPRKAASERAFSSLHAAGPAEVRRHRAVLKHRIAASIGDCMADLFLGTKATKEFYEKTGWHKKEGVLIDSVLFTPPTVGPILKSILERRKAALRDLIGGPGLHLLECGSGARPALFLASRCESFTAVDFSTVGLAEAAAKLTASGLAFRTVEADITRLPFRDGEFDVAYSAHVLYHIANPDGQSAALAEMMRVVRPGGRVVLVLANPFPLLFPGRLLRRVLAETPVIKKLLNAIRTRPALPYQPMRLGWYEKQCSKWGDVQILGNALPSSWFDRNLSERNSLGRATWKLIDWIERAHPRAASRLGCYVTICATNRTSKPATGEVNPEQPPAASVDDPPSEQAA